MSAELTPYTAPEGVTLVEIRMDSNRFPRVKALQATAAVARLEQVVLMAYTYTGRPAPADRCRMVAAALYTELMEDKKQIGTANITIEEVAHAVKSAILEADGDIYINIAFLYKAVCAYALGEGHDAQQHAEECPQMRQAHGVIRHLAHHTFRKSVVFHLHRLCGLEELFQ